MKWKGNRASTNVDDARGRRVVAGGGSGAAGLLLNMVGRRFGIKGILVLVVVGVVLWKAGLMDPAQMLGGAAQTQSVPYQPTAEEQERFDFVTVMLGYTEDVWKAEFARHDATYQEPTLVIYTGQEPTGCGMGSAQMGPFYCPADRKVYIDLSFYDELERSFDAPGDFAQAYVIAHEVGHHVQNQLEILKQVHAARSRMNTREANALSVRLELQADCLAGVWAHHAERARHILEEGDVEEALNAASAIGDDRIQRQTQGRVVPDSFTHGTSQQRVRWFLRGLESGELGQCNTFESGTF